MILKTTGDFIMEDMQRLAVGDRVMAVASDYAGLKGYITEIRTGLDKETDNISHDVYCCFDIPADKEKVKMLEKHFSELFGESKTIDELSIDLVIMAPDMLRKVESYE